MPTNGAVVAKEGSCREIVEILWNLIDLLCDFKDILITVPHNPVEEYSGELPHYQLRCWKGEPGPVSGGHIDSGTAKHATLLFEIQLKKKLNECKCCFPDQLSDLGIRLVGPKFKKGVHQSRTGEKYDVITIVTP